MTKRRWGWVAAGLSVVMSGCLTPRTGEYYQETKAARIGAWWKLTSDDGIFTIFSLIGVPVKVLFQGIDLGFVNPVCDTFLLPVDAFYPHHERYYRVVDETGKPVVGAAVQVNGTYADNGWAAYALSETVQDSGTTDAEGLVRISRRHRRYEPFDATVVAEGCHTRRFVFHADRKAFAPEPDAKGRPVTTLTVNRERRPIDGTIRTFDLPLAWTVGEQHWVRSYDLALGAWLPPFGGGKRADITLEARFSKKDGTRSLVMIPGESSAVFARVKMQPHCDPRFFAIDYEIPASASFQTEFHLQCEGQKAKPEWRYDYATEYVIYRVRREDGYHSGALVPTGIGSAFRNIYNPTPGSMTLEYR